MSVLLVPLHGKNIYLGSASKETGSGLRFSPAHSQRLCSFRCETLLLCQSGSLFCISSFSCNDFLKGSWHILCTSVRLTLLFIHLFFWWQPSCGWGLTPWEYFLECFQQNKWLWHLPAFRLPNGQLEKPKVTWLRQSSSACAPLKWFNVS